VWSDIQSIQSDANERLGYPAQKPEALLERIIKASSNEDDIVLDAFCGCGTTVAVAQRLKRKWIGIDITYQSISLILKRMAFAYGSDILGHINLFGAPKDMDSAVALANKSDDRTRKEFEKWAVLTYSNNLAIINEKKGGDGGIDGVAFIGDLEDKNKVNKQILLSVKSDKKLNPSVIRDLNGTMERDGAVMGILITLYPMVNMVKESKKYGLYKNQLSHKESHRIEVISVQDILGGRRLSFIADVLAVTKNAEKKAQAEQEEINF
jgi:site-specific DNA-methyltransferase (adenine-specific)